MHRDYHYEAEVSLSLADPTTFTHSITILHMVGESGSNSHSQYPHRNREMHLQTFQHTLCCCYYSMQIFLYHNIKPILPI